MRYVIAEEPNSLWGHIPYPGAPEIYTRFVYDREDGKMVVAERMGKFSHEDGGYSWFPLDGSLRDELEASLKVANSEALDAPDSWGLVESDEMPVWADQHLPQPARI